MATRGPYQCLENALDTFIGRGGTYGEAYKQFGPIMMALFPRGLNLTNADDWNRYACFHMVVAKLARYANSFEFGHEDSAHDIIVYAAMLESLDIAQRAKREAEADAKDASEVAAASAPENNILCSICDSQYHTAEGHFNLDQEVWIR